MMGLIMGMGIRSPTQAERWQHGILRLIAGGDGSFCVFLCGWGGGGQQRFGEFSGSSVCDGWLQL